jgi:nicotinamidase-related amidase
MMPRVQFEIQSKRTALIIVDMQNDFLLPGAQGHTPDGLNIIPNIRKLSDSCRSVGIPVIYVVHVLRRDGSDVGILGEIFGEGVRSIVLEGSMGAEIHGDLKPQKEDIVIKKLRFSAFQGTELETLLRSKGVDTVMIAGVTTETCCETTARDAMHREFKVVFISDATAAHDFADVGFGFVPHEEVQKVTCTILGTKFGMVAKTEDVVKMIDTRSQQ